MTSRSFLSVIDLESSYPIFDRICSFLSIDSIIALTRTCRALSGLYQALVPLQWNVDRLLARFVRDPQSFRSQMGRHNGLVSGSLAVQFFERVIWKESDLDIFIERGENAEAFAKYLTEKEGYKFNNTATGRQNYGPSYIEEVRTYTKRSEGDSAELKAQIIFTWNVPVQAILKGFYSTVVVNFFTWNKAYAIFPLPTFVHHKGYLLKPLDNYISSLLEKYSRRGWRFQGAMWPEEETRSKQPVRASRLVGDEFTWTIPFDTSNVNWSKTPDFVLEYGDFELQLSHWAASSNYKIAARWFHAEVLRHNYLVTSISWMTFLGARVDELTVLELYKLAPEKRLARFQGAITQTNVGVGIAMSMWMEREMADFQKPDSWTYWDDEIPKWHQASLQSETQSKKDQEDWN